MFPLGNRIKVIYICHFFFCSNNIALWNVLEKEKGNPLQYSCLENPMDGGAWCPWGRKESDMTE